jgi:hypothetical protein
MPNWTFGLDLGQARDYSALVVTERVLTFVLYDELATFEVAPDRPLDAYWLDERLVVDEYHVRHLQRWALGTPYDVVVEQVAELMRAPDLRGRAVLALDKTGVGTGVADMFHAAHRQGRLGDLPPRAFTLTAGFSAKGGAGGRANSASTIHKGDLVGRVVRLNESDRIKIPPGLSGSEDLVRELRGFTLKQNTRTGNVTYEAAKEAIHDDYVIALALSVWMRHRRDQPRYIDADTLQLKERA